MTKDQERILELHEPLSKLLDTLCFEICVNRRDENCKGLLEELYHESRILIWKRKGDINEEEFYELYRSWLESKSVFDLFTCRQLETYSKHELIADKLVQDNFLSISHINKALELINKAYNKFYHEKKPSLLHQLDQSERIFSYLDEEGYIHLRLSSIFFLTGAIIILEKFTIPINDEAFRIHMNDLRKEMFEIEGIVPLRNFKNYLLNLNSVKRANYLDNLLNIFTEIDSAIGNEKKTGFINLFTETFDKWKNFPRFNSSENRKNLEAYKRVFGENEKIFYDSGATTKYFEEIYGEEFVKCYQIDNALLREFNILLKETINRYIEIFAKVSYKLSSKGKNQEKTNLMMTHRKNLTSDLTQLKMSHKGSSMKERTPTKSQKNTDYKNSRTPTKTSNYDNYIRKEFGSADKSKSKTYNLRQTTPTKSYRGPTMLHQSQANTNQKNAIKLGIDKDSFYNKMNFFRNKRVESYDIVMKRLRNNK